jgi:hypothetical protein
VTSVGGARKGKVEAKKELIHAIRDALDGRIYVSEAVGWAPAGEGRRGSQKSERET